MIWGYNPVATNPHVVPLLQEAKRHGATIVLIDPRISETARYADWQIQPYPGTDGALALALMNVIVAEPPHDAAFLRTERTVGWEAFRDRAASFTPERASEITRLPTASIRRLAELYAERRPGLIVDRPGPPASHQRWPRGHALPAGAACRHAPFFRTVADLCERDRRRPGSVGVRGSSPSASPFSTRPPSLREGGFHRSWCRRGGHLQSVRCRLTSTVHAHPVGRVAAERGHHVAVGVRGLSHPCVAKDLHDDAGVNGPWTEAASPPCGARRVVGRRCAAPVACLADSA